MINIDKLFFLIDTYIPWDKQIYHTYMKYIEFTLVASSYLGKYFELCFNNVDVKLTNLQMLNNYYLHNLYCQI